MDQVATTQRSPGPRHSILDLAPLELECMSVLWPLGEGTVRDIHRQLAKSRPRAYTTIMTIMDRLAHKGVVTRRRVGRAYRYQAHLSVNEARMSAIEKIVAGFFDGSPEALLAHLAAAGGASRASAAESTPVVASRKEARIAANLVHREPSAEASEEQSVTRQPEKALL